VCLLPGCFRREQVICSVPGVGLGQETVIDNGVEYCAAGLELTPGVYQVRLHVDSEYDGDMFAEVYADAAYHKSLLGNGAPVFAGSEYVDFEVYVTDKIDQAGVKLQIYGDNASCEAVELLEVYRTSMGCRMLLFLAVLAFACLDALIFWRSKILEGKVSAEQQMVVWGLIGVTLVSSFACLSDYLVIGNDTYFHLLRIESLKESLRNGTSLPVRVQDYWLYGHGYAVSLFYGDFYILLPVFLRLLGFPMNFAYNFFLTAVTAAVYLIFYFSYMSCKKDRKAAAYGAIFYSLAPYRILDLYVRSALGESLAFIFLPLIAAGFYLLVTEDPNGKKYRQYKWYLIIGISSVLYCHIISTEFVLLMLVIGCIIMWKQIFRKETVKQLLQGAGITLVLTCWFWLPMLYMLQTDQYILNATISKIKQEKGISFSRLLQYLPNAGFNFEGLQGGANIQIGAAAGAVLLMLVFFHMIRIEKWRRSEIIMMGLIIGLLFVSSEYFPWNLLQDVPVLGKMSASWQFPFRWMMVVSLFVAFLAADTYRRWRMESGSWHYVVPLLVISLTVGSAIYQVNDLLQTQLPIYLYTTENMGSIAVAYGEYLPYDADPEDYHVHMPYAEEGMTYTDYEKKGLQIEMTISNPTDKDLGLELPLTGYKGYAVETVGDADSETKVRIDEERGMHGDLKLIVPAGYEGTIRVWYNGFALFRMAELISLIGIIGVVAMEVMKCRKNSLAAAREQYVL